jgi:nucleoside-diphosphate-sugar epimerase
VGAGGAGLIGPHLTEALLEAGHYEEAYEPGFEDLRRRLPDIRKAERVAGCRPRGPLDETLERVISHLHETGRS